MLVKRLTIFQSASHGAKEFILACLEGVREVLPGGVIEVRMDSPFFSDEIVTALSRAGIEFTLSVPFERFAELKRRIEGCGCWWELGREVGGFEEWWKPESWDREYRFVFVRTRVKRQQKGPVQLDLFVPYEPGYEFKVVLTNKALSRRNVRRYGPSSSCTRFGRWCSSGQAG